MPRPPVSPHPAATALRPPSIRPELWPAGGLRQRLAGLGHADKAYLAETVAWPLTIG